MAQALRSDLGGCGNEAARTNRRVKTESATDQHRKHGSDKIREQRLEIRNSVSDLCLLSSLVLIRVFGVDPWLNSLFSSLSAFIVRLFPLSSHDQLFALGEPVVGNALRTNG